MGKISAFLSPIGNSETKEVIISSRFKDENGEDVPFVIKALRQDEIDEITRKCTITKKINGTLQDKLDNLSFARHLIVAGTVEPDFKSTDMCNAYGVLDPLLVPGKLLLAGEYSKLSNAIAQLSGFEDIDTYAKN